MGGHQSGSAGGAVPLHPGGPVTAGAAGSRAQADVGDRDEPPARGGHVWASGERAGRGRGVPRPSPFVPAALGRMTQQPKQRQRQEEAAGGRRGGEGRDKPAQGEGGGRGGLGGRRSRGAWGRAPPHPTSLTSNRPGGHRASGGLSVVGAGGQSDPAGKGIPEAPSSEGRPALGAGGNTPSRQPVSRLAPAPCHIR